MLMNIESNWTISPKAVLLRWWFEGATSRHSCICNKVEYFLANCHTERMSKKWVKVKCKEMMKVKSKESFKWSLSEEAKKPKALLFRNLCVYSGGAHWMTMTLRRDLLVSRNTFISLITLFFAGFLCIVLALVILINCYFVNIML